MMSEQERLDNVSRETIKDKLLEQVSKLAEDRLPKGHIVKKDDVTWFWYDEEPKSKIRAVIVSLKHTKYHVTVVRSVEHDVMFKKRLELLAIAEIIHAVYGYVVFINKENKYNLSWLVIGKDLDKSIGIHLDLDYKISMGVSYIELKDNPNRYKISGDGIGAIYGTNINPFGFVTDFHLSDILKFNLLEDALKVNDSNYYRPKSKMKYLTVKEFMDRKNEEYIEIKSEYYN